MNDKNKLGLIDSTEFLEFVSNEFENTVQHATIEELAEFAFGNIETAIVAYNNIKK
jgi:hypothetical protein